VAAESGLVVPENELQWTVTHPRPHRPTSRGWTRSSNGRAPTGWRCANCPILPTTP